jgi:hypothetical protein
MATAIFREMNIFVKHGRCQGKVTLEEALKLALRHNDSTSAPNLGQSTAGLSGREEDKLTSSSMAISWHNICGRVIRY